ncbi:ATP-binding cassette domain-containing protein [Helicobacter cappadocius]|uniref:ATP-binding cassette domain-containing protein n=1 Tax=Helicobacter cappadocius TaxID=3063998 RepID=A0AA90PJH2_9HELI|nr:MULTISPECIES: ATP-binding cassette domain-containing protein [unclassified Helicobacter]MDO7253015.1 ATP-binding cassette domain-containing protein [Helicobacter sp. faydin-H75]MDP2538996.1 ATP-binding cassette domain-containing protein [Helicobacter sp. faydin-H76]
MIELQVQKHLYGVKGEFVLELDIRVPIGRFVSIFGKSGAGKSTILRMLSGLQKPDSGRIMLGNKVFFDSEKNINLPIKDRKVGFVFQDYALFPHLNVYKNIIFGNNKDKNRIDEVISLMELESFCDKKICTLSGGQAQRVAIARAFVSSPEVLLLDEPLSALDRGMKHKIQEELKSLSKHFNISSFFVSHDLGEVFRLSDYVISIEDGKILKFGTPQEVFLNQKYSGKMQINGEILNITKTNVVCIADVLVDHSIVKITLDPSEAREFKVGDRVVIIAKAFNPSMVLL